MLGAPSGMSHERRWAGRRCSGDDWLKRVSPSLLELGTLLSLLSNPVPQAPKPAGRCLRQAEPAEPRTARTGPRRPGRPEASLLVEQGSPHDDDGGRVRLRLMGNMPAPVDG
jgi:hypothetical protein